MKVLFFASFNYFDNVNFKLWLQIPNIIDFMVWPLLSIVHLILALNRFVIVAKTIFWPGCCNIQTRFERLAFNVYSIFYWFCIFNKVKECIILLKTLNGWKPFFTRGQDKLPNFLPFSIFKPTNFLLLMIIPGCCQS